jgi:hypothetical protein
MYQTQLTRYHPGISQTLLVSFHDTGSSDKTSLDDCNLQLSEKLFFSFSLLLTRLPKINFLAKNRLLWHFWYFLAFFFFGLYKLEQVQQKVCAGLLMRLRPTLPMLAFKVPFLTSK